METWNSEVIVHLPGGERRRWELEQRLDAPDRWTVILRGDHGEISTATGEGLWTAFTRLRRQLDELGVKICCAGARIDANMRSGRWVGGDVVDILSRRTLIGIRRTAPMLSYAPPRLIASVAQQEERYERWLKTPWWRALLPGNPVG